MTGITDICITSRRLKRHIYAFLRLYVFVRRVEVPAEECPQPTLPDPRPTLRLAAKKTNRVADAAEKEPPDAAESAPAIANGPLTWALLLPITSRGQPSASAFWLQFEAVAKRLAATTDATCTQVLVGIDQNDPVLDTDASRIQITALLAPLQLTFRLLPPALSGGLCWIWEQLAQEAVAAGADLFLLVGDDVLFEQHVGSWQSAVKAQFAQVAATTGLPFGCACIAVRDAAFPAFPTFPVIHRLHFTIFQQLFPSAFKNQHGDPFLWEVYRRWGASCFAAAQLTNTQGGKQEARYTKAGGFVWRNALLTDAIATLQRWLAVNAPAARQVPCLDVVIPTFRGNVKLLQSLSRLQCPPDIPVSLHTLIIVDNPDADIPAIEKLTSYAANRTVRVYAMPGNKGASMARNAGLSQCFGDHAILLDDDVVPSKDLVPAYLSAIARYPQAAGYVGLTTLPPASTLIQNAIETCDICFFYGIAKRKRRPPWGVTANLCVPARTNNAVWCESKLSCVLLHSCVALQLAEPWH